MKNFWKIAFFSLLAVIIAAVTSILLLINMHLPDLEEIELSQNKNSLVGNPIFTIQAKKANLNQLIDEQLEPMNNKEQPIRYTVLLKDHVIFQGSLTVFNRELDFSMLLDPEVQENGDLLLKQKSFQIGFLKVPSDEVLRFLQKSASLPEWVIVQPKKESVYVALTELEFKENMSIKAKHIDLKNDHIVFEVYYSTENTTN
ncbi:YpmS family protein [Bacillus taeanensis]|nr:YpmS family protein [Bacillus taeanensis]